MRRIFDPGPFFLHDAAAGCISASASGGDCGQGAASAGFSKLGTIAFNGYDNGIGGFVASAVIGGTASVIGGGKFENGAATAAFGYLYNNGISQLLNSLQMLYYRVAPYASQAVSVLEAVAYGAAGATSPSTVLMPGGAPVGRVLGGATDDIRSVTQTEMDRIIGNLLNQSTEISPPKGFSGRWFSLGEGGEWGMRMSSSGMTLQLHKIPGVPIQKIHEYKSLVDQIPR